MSARRERRGPLPTLIDVMACHAPNDVELRALLVETLEALPQGCRVVFVLRAVDGMSAAEVAECLGVPEDSVRETVARVIAVTGIDPLLALLWRLREARRSAV